MLGAPAGSWEGPLELGEDPAQAWFLLVRAMVETKWAGGRRKAHFCSERTPGS